MPESLVAEACNCLTVQARANETKYTGVSSADAKGSFGKSSTSAFGSIGQLVTNHEPAVRLAVADVL